MLDMSQCETCNEPNINYATLRIIIFTYMEDSRKILTCSTRIIIIEMRIYSNWPKGMILDKFNDLWPVFEQFWYSTFYSFLLVIYKTHSEQIKWKLYNIIMWPIPPCSYKRSSFFMITANFYAAIRYVRVKINGMPSLLYNDLLKRIVFSVRQSFADFFLFQRGVVHSLDECC